jgi:hypothetical protein
MLKHISFEVINIIEEELIRQELYSLNCDCSMCNEISYALSVLREAAQKEIDNQNFVTYVMDDRRFDESGNIKE